MDTLCIRLIYSAVHSVGKKTTILVAMYARLVYVVYIVLKSIMHIPGARCILVFSIADVQKVLEISSDTMHYMCLTNAHIKMQFRIRDQGVLVTEINFHSLFMFLQDRQQFKDSKR